MCVWVCWCVRVCGGVSVCVWMYVGVCMYGWVSVDLLVWVCGFVCVCVDVCVCLGALHAYLFPWYSFHTFGYYISRKMLTMRLVCLPAEKRLPAYHISCGHRP